MEKVPIAAISIAFRVDAVRADHIELVQFNVMIGYAFEALVRADGGAIDQILCPYQQTIDIKMMPWRNTDIPAGHGVADGIGFDQDGPHIVKMRLRDAIDPIMAVAYPAHCAQAAAAKDVIAGLDVLHRDLALIGVDHRSAQEADGGHELAGAVHEARRIGEDCRRQFRIDAGHIEGDSLFADQCAVRQHERRAARNGIIVETVKFIPIDANAVPPVEAVHVEGRDAVDQPLVIGEGPGAIAGEIHGLSAKVEPQNRRPLDRYV